MSIEMRAALGMNSDITKRENQHKIRPISNSDGAVYGEDYARALPLAWLSLSLCALLDPTTTSTCASLNAKGWDDFQQ